MKNLILLLSIVCSSVAFAGGRAIPIPGTSLTYEGPSDVITISGVLTNHMPYYPWSNVPWPTNTIIIIIPEPGENSCKIVPTNKSSQDSIILIIEGGPRKIMVDFGQSKGAGTIPYMYVNGNAGKILFKGMGSDVCRIVVDNETADKGVHLQNISKGTGNTGSGFKDIITMGKLKRAQSNHAGFGARDACAIGIIMIGKDSPKGQIKASSKGEVASVLICKNVDTNIFVNFQTAYFQCIASNAVLPGVEMGNLKMINTKALGPAVIAVDVDKKFKNKQVGKRIKLTSPVVGTENIID